MLLLCYCRSPHSGTVDSDTPGMLHAEQSLHDSDTGDVVGLTSAAANVEASNSAAESDTPSTATQSAVYQQPGEDGYPVYRGFQDPKSQSATFKKLQSFIESGEGKRVKQVTIFIRPYLNHVQLHHR